MYLELMNCRVAMPSSSCRVMSMPAIPCELGLQEKQLYSPSNQQLALDSSTSELDQARLALGQQQFEESCAETWHHYCGHCSR